MFTKNFQSFVMPGDSTTCEVDGFTITARIHADGETKPTDYDCYSQDDIDQWLDDEWFFGGLVLSVELDGVVLAPYAAALWGIDCNLGPDNTYLQTCANDLLPEALEAGKAALQRLIAARPFVETV